MRPVHSTHQQCERSRKIYLAQSKEIPELRKKLVKIHQSRKRYKDTHKALRRRRTSVRAIISKFRKLGSKVNLRRSDQPSQKSSVMSHSGSHTRANENIYLYRCEDTTLNTVLLLQTMSKPNNMI